MKGQQVFWDDFWDEKPFDLKELPEPYHPESKILNGCIQEVSDLELIALLVGGTKRESALDIAGRILALGDRLQNITTRELMFITGSRQRAIRLVAALELGRRLMSRSADRRVIRGPEDAAEILKPRLRHLDREHFFTILLNTKNRVLAVKQVAIGMLDSVPIHPREVFKSAIAYSAASVIISHNHPSGDPTPSRQDIDITKHIIEAGNVVKIPVLDHIIIGGGGGSWVSLRKEGLM